MPLKEADKSYDFKKIEEKVQKFWADNDIYDKTNTLRADGPQYSFLDGPPYCSGKIHLDERIQLEKAGRMGYSWIAYRAQG